jgi:DNA-binding IclR family transcriptional regulator
VLVVERNFAELSGEITRDYFGKHHEPGLRVGRHGEAVLERSGAISSADPGTEVVSSRLKATVGLMKIEAVEFAM